MARNIGYAQNASRICAELLRNVGSSIIPANAPASARKYGGQMREMRRAAKSRTTANVMPSCRAARSMHWYRLRVTRNPLIAKKSSTPTGPRLAMTFASGPSCPGR